jgi:hypothetical protein
VPLVSRRTADPRSDRPRRDWRKWDDALGIQSRAEVSGIRVPLRNLAERRQGLWPIVCLFARVRGVRPGRHDSAYRLLVTQLKSIAHLPSWPCRFDPGRPLHTVHQPKRRPIPAMGRAAVGVGAISPAITPLGPMLQPRPYRSSTRARDRRAVISATTPTRRRLQLTLTS